MGLNCEETKAKERGKSSWKRVDASVYWRLGNLINATWNSSNGLSLKSIPYRSILFFFFPLIFQSQGDFLNRYHPTTCSLVSLIFIVECNFRILILPIVSINRTIRISFDYFYTIRIRMYVINEQRKLMENRHFSNIVLSGEAVCSLGFN